jgi:hypothetical protein
MGGKGENRGEKDRRVKGRGGEKEQKGKGRDRKIEGGN